MINLVLLTYATFGRSGSPPLPSFPCFPAFSVAQLSFSGGVFPLFIPGTKQEECRLLCFKLKCPPDIEELIVANQMPDPSLFHPCRCNLGSPRSLASILSPPPPPLLLLLLYFNRRRLRWLYEDCCIRPRLGGTISMWRSSFPHIHPTRGTGTSATQSQCRGRW